MEGSAVQGSQMKKKRGRKPKSFHTAMAMMRTEPNRTSSRERKSVHRFMATITSSKPRYAVIQKGNGMAFKYIPNLAYKVSKKCQNDHIIKLLHSILYGKLVKTASRKYDILEFSGFLCNDSKVGQKLIERIYNISKEELAEVCNFLELDVPKYSGNKEDLALGLLDFLKAPYYITSYVNVENEHGVKRKRGRRRKDIFVNAAIQLLQDPGGSSGSMDQIESLRTIGAHQDYFGTSNQEEFDQVEDDTTSTTLRNMEEFAQRVPEFEQKNEIADIKRSRGGPRIYNRPDFQYEANGGPLHCGGKKVSEIITEPKGVKRGRGRPRKRPSELQHTKSSVNYVIIENKYRGEIPAVKRGRGRPRKRPLQLQNPEDMPGEEVLEKGGFVESGHQEEIPFDLYLRGEVLEDNLPYENEQEEMPEFRNIDAVRKSRGIANPEAIPIKNDMPTDFQLCSAIREFLCDVDFESATLSDVVNHLGKQFNHDLTNQRDHIIALIQQELTKMSEESYEED